MLMQFKKQGSASKPSVKLGGRSTTDRNRPRPVNVEFFSPWSVTADPRFGR